MANYFFDQLDKGKARRDAQKAQNQAVLSSLIDRKDKEDTQRRDINQKYRTLEATFEQEDKREVREDVHQNVLQDDKQVHEQSLQTKDLRFKTSDRIMTEMGLDRRLVKKIASDEKINWTNQKEAMKQLKQAGVNALDLQGLKNDQSWKELKYSVTAQKQIKRMELDGSMDQLVTRIGADIDLLSMSGDQKIAQLDKTIAADDALQTKLKTMDVAESVMVQKAIKDRLSMELSSRSSMQKSLFKHERGQLQTKIGADFALQDDAQKHQWLLTEEELALKAKQEKSMFTLDTARRLGEMELSSSLKKDQMGLDSSLKIDQIKASGETEGQLLDKKAGYKMDELVTELVWKGGENDKNRKARVDEIKGNQDFQMEVKQADAENNIIGGLIQLDINRKDEASKFKFTANPFLLGKTSNMLGVNYKEGMVLDKVTNNLPTLQMAVDVAKNLPDVDKTGVGSLWGGKTIDPRKQKLLDVLYDYKENLDQKGDRFWNPTPWKNESDHVKKQASVLFGDVNSMIELLEGPIAAPIDPSVYTSQVSYTK